MSKDFEDLPYGFWHCEDGSVYLFNRHYKPLYRRSPDGELSIPDRKSWIYWTAQTYFYEGYADRATIKRLRYILDSFVTGAQSDYAAIRAAIQKSKGEGES